MSDSRLEKFIYAICSMDVTDLPVPLSRIEKLWNCLITGETPDFEPLSRNEKYLMAMLDRYDISNLPAPMSRGEKLLYKIAVGETDLSDVPGYLSRYEELLKYLIENGGISGGDFEYVLYTLNQSLSTLYTTAEKPVKSAILKGQTLVNISDINKFSLSRNERLSTKNKVQVGKTYLQVIAITKNTLSPANDKGNVASINDSDGVNNFANDYYKVAINETRILKKVYTVTSTSGKNDTSVRTYSITTEGVLEGYEMLIEYQDGMENWDIPYFEGMQSVKMPVLTTTGKNLFDMNNASYATGLIHVGNQTINQTSITKAYYIPCEPNTTYTISKMMTKYFRICETSVVPTYGCSISNTVNNPSKASLTITTSESAKYLCFNVHNVKEDTVDESEVLATLQIEKGTVATSYEPYKSNILTVNEEVELRGVGKVKDELNLLTGELVKNFGSLYFDGSENWRFHLKSGTAVVYKLNLPNLNHNFSMNTSLADKIPVTGRAWTGEKGISLLNQYVYLTVEQSIANTSDDLKKWISSIGGINLIYRLPQGTVKTVDLTTVDQDNQPTKLGTFENVTHVSLESAGLIPEVEMEVATNLLEDTVFNLTNAFNTLYPTAAKPVVDGTLYGQTLLSVSNYTFLTGKYLDVYKGGFNGGNEAHRYVETYFSIPTEAKTITLKGNNNYKKICYYDANKTFIIGHQLQTTETTDLKTDVPTGASYFRFNTSLTENSNYTIDEYLHVYIDDYLYLTNKSDYREGAKLFTCKSPGVTMTNEDNTKSITLSTPSDLELRKVGEVQDEMNVMTGEVVERIGEFILNGSEYWDIVNDTFRTGVINDKVIKLETQADRDKIVISCDRYPSRTYNDPWTTSSGNFISLTIGKVIVINDSSFTTVKELKEYLSQNPLTIKFVLATPTTKTVDLSIVNQNGNETKLRTFDYTTHVLLQSEAGPNPGAALTVRTKIPSASSTSLLMDELSTEQQQLSDTVDEQSNNVDATMIATTEIYEETL